MIINIIMIVVVIICMCVFLYALYKIRSICDVEDNQIIQLKKENNKDE